MGIRKSILRPNNTSQKRELLLMPTQISKNEISFLSSDTLAEADCDQRLHVYIDCDPGNDDCFLLIMLLHLYKKHSDRLKIIGISASYGNASVSNTLNNVTSMINVMNMGNYGINLYKGAEEGLAHKGPLSYPIKIHGKNGMGDIKELDNPDLSLTKGKITSTEMLRLFKDIKSHSDTKQDKIILISTGPFSLISRFILEKTELKSLVDKVIVMGGNFENERGNSNSLCSGEFNMFTDPDAANVIFMDPFMKSKCIIFPLNITHKAILDHKQMKMFSESNRKNKEITATKRSFLKLLEKFSEFYKTSADNSNHEFDKGPPMHDVLTIMPVIEYLYAEKNLNWSFKELDFVVETEGSEIGKTHILNSPGKSKTLIKNTDESAASLIDYKQESCLVMYDMNFDVFWQYFQKVFDEIDHETYVSDRK